MLWPGGWCRSCFRDQTLLLYMSNGSQKSQTNTRADIIGKYYDFWQQLNKYFTISYRTELYIILTYLFVQVKIVGYNQFIASAGSLLVWISFISYHAIPTFRPLFRFFIDTSMLIHPRVHVWGVLSVLKGNTACKMFTQLIDWHLLLVSETKLQLIQKLNPWFSFSYFLSQHHWSLDAKFMFSPQLQNYFVIFH